ncbi:MAG: DUF3298 domain-containing protein [Pseudomonadota bacterium]
MIKRVCLAASFMSLAACSSLPDQTVSDGPEIVAELADQTVDQRDPMVTPVSKDLLPALIEVEDETYFASAEFPPDLQMIAPELDASLRADAMTQFESVAAMSKEMATEDAEFFRPYGIGFTWDVLEYVAPLVSLKGLYYEDFGGAHPNYGLIGLLYDTDTQAEIDVASLFSEPEAAPASLYPLVREAIIQAKLDRLTEYGLTEDEIISDVDYTFSEDGTWLSTSALTSSTETDHFGGIIVYFSPYEIGPYAEGSYEVPVAQADFRDWLKPEYQAMFGGDPVVPLDEDGA